MPRYEIRTSKKADAYELEQLRRAFARTAGQCSPAIETVDVFAERRCLLVAMTIVGSDADVRRDGEQAFAVAWYDAFGRRSSTHVGRLTDVPSPAHVLSVADGTARVQAAVSAREVRPGRMGADLVLAAGVTRT